MRTDYFADLPKKSGNLGNLGNPAQEPSIGAAFDDTYPVTQAKNDWVTRVTGHADSTNQWC